MRAVPPSWMKKRPLPDSFILQFPVPCSPANNDNFKSVKFLMLLTYDCVVKVADPTSVYIWVDQPEFVVLLDRAGNRRTQLSPLWTSFSPLLTLQLPLLTLCRGNFETRSDRLFQVPPRPRNSCDVHHLRSKYSSYDDGQPKNLNNNQHQIMVNLGWQTPCLGQTESTLALSSQVSTWKVSSKIFSTDPMVI